MVLKKRIVRPNLGGALRPRADQPRRNFLYIEVTEHERKIIQDYCVRNHVSISQFLAELLLDDASKPKPIEKVILRPELEFTAAELEKLELLAMLHNKSSVHELIRDLIQRSLETQHLHSDRETTMIRFYLSQEEHQTIATHIAAKRLPAGKYVAMLALKALAKDRSKKT
jgi:hypothetical protein